RVGDNDASLTVHQYHVCVANVARAFDGAVVGKDGGGSGPLNEVLRVVRHDQQALGTVQGYIAADVEDCDVAARSHGKRAVIGDRPHQGRGGVVVDLVAAAAAEGEPAQRGVAVGKNQPAAAGGQRPAGNLD